MRRSLILLITCAFFGVACLTWLASAQLTSGSPTRDTPPAADPDATKKVDVNRASIENLCRLPGISREVGQRIIKHRPYRKLDDMVVRKVLSKKQFARIREYISVGNGS